MLSTDVSSVLLTDMSQLIMLSCFHMFLSHVHMVTSLQGTERTITGLEYYVLPLKSVDENKTMIFLFVLIRLTVNVYYIH